MFIYGWGNFLMFEVLLKDLIEKVIVGLKEEGLKVWDLRLNGSIVSSILSLESNCLYNDIDLIFGVEICLSFYL